MPDVGIQPLPRARTWGAVATCVQQHARVSTKPRMRFPGRREGVQVPRSFRSISHSRTHMLIHICARVRAHVHTRTQHTHTHSCRLLCVHAGTQLTHAHGYTHTHIHLHWHTRLHTRVHTHTPMWRWLHYSQKQQPVQIHAPPSMPLHSPPVLRIGNANAF